MITQRIFRNATATLVLGAAALSFSTQSLAAPIITPTMDANILVNALVGGGGVGIDLSTLTVSYSGHGSGSAASSGTYTNATEYGIAPGVILSSGSVNQFGTGSSSGAGISASGSQEALLQPISGISEHFDVTELTINFDMLPGFSSIFFNVTFQSVEFPEYLGTEFIDAFGLYVNGVNIAFVNSDPINIDHPFMGNDDDFGNGVLGSTPAGEGVSAGGALFHTFSSTVNATGNTVTFIIADSGDTALDSFAFISQLGGSAPPPINPVPVPATLGLMGIGLLMAAFGSALRRRRQG